MATVSDILEKKGRFVATVGRSASVLEAAREMNARRIGALVVVEQGQVAGIFSERDVLIRIVAAQRDPAQTRVEEVMTTPVACCHPNTPISECQSLMTVKRVRHLPVVENGQLAGILTIGDLIAREVGDQQAVIGYLYEYIHGPHAGAAPTEDKPASPRQGDSQPGS